MNYEDQEKLISQKLARYQQQQDQQAPQGRMVGNRYIAANPLEYLAAGLRGYGGARGAEMASKELNDLQKQKQEAVVKALRGFQEMSQGRPADVLPEGQAGPVRPEQKPDLAGAYASLADSGVADLQKVGLQGVLQMPQMQAQQQAREDDRAFRQQEAQAAREARAAELKMRMEDQRTSQQEKLAAQRELQQMQIDARKDMQRMIASNRPAPQAQIIQTDSGPMQLVNGRAVPIVGPDGRPVAGKAAAAGSATEGERKAATLLQRMQNSEAQLEAALKKDKTAAKPGLLSSGLRSMGLEALANTSTPESRQKVEAAQLDILDAALTLGTGAAYTKEQLEGYRKSYFPQIGDDPGTVEDKQARLDNILEAARIAAGRAGGQVTAPALPPRGIGKPKPAGGIVDFGSLK